MANLLVELRDFFADFFDFSALGNLTDKFEAFAIIVYGCSCFGYGAGMPHRASSNATSMFYPPMEVLEPLIDYFDPYEHWLWNGEFNKRCEAIIRWAPPRAPQRYTFIVVRVVFLHYFQRPIPHRRPFIATCKAAPACINPMHWKVLTKEEEQRQGRYVVITGGRDHELVRTRKR